MGQANQICFRYHWLFMEECCVPKKATPKRLRTTSSHWDITIVLALPLVWMKSLSAPGSPQTYGLPWREGLCSTLSKRTTCRALLASTYYEQHTPYYSFFPFLLSVNVRNVIIHNTFFILMAHSLLEHCVRTSSNRPTTFSLFGKFEHIIKCENST